MNTNKLAWLTLAFASTMMLSACGGSDGGSSSPPPPPPPPATPTLAISGTASTGPAIANGTVEVKCATGTASTTTGADGTFHTSITSGALPCVLRATTSNGTFLHAVAAGSGATAVANITPLTELVTANLSGGTPDTLYTNFDSAAQAQVTPTTVATAISSTSSALQGTVDLTGANPLTDTITAPSGTTAGSTADQQVTQLTTAISDAQTTLAALDTSIGTATPSSPPILHQAAAQATSCASLRSGLYRVIKPSYTGQPDQDATSRVRIDAQALTYVNADAGSDQSLSSLTAVAGTPCSFTFDDDFGTGTILFSTGGAGVVRAPSSTGPTMTYFVVPEQTVSLAQLAGSWNYLTYQPNDNGVFAPSSGQVVFDATGHVPSGIECVGLTCTTAPADDLPALLTVDTEGGFDSGDNQGTTRYFAVVADNGAKTIFVMLPNQGGMLVLEQQNALTLPAVGKVSNFWDFTVGTEGFTWAPDTNSASSASSLNDYTETVTAIDTTAQTYTRLRASDQRVDTFAINNPRSGLRYRAASSSASETISLPLPGLGLAFSISVSATQNFFDISVDHP